MSGSYNLLQIENVVRQRGDYLKSQTFTPAYVQGEIQAAWSELYELIADTWEGWWDKQTQLATVAAQQQLALPSDAWRVLGLDILVSGYFHELRQVGIGDRNRFGPTNKQPSAYRLSSRGFELYPTPDNVYTLQLTYTPMVTPLDPVTATQFYNDWQEYVVTSALLRLDQREERPLQERLVELERVKERIVKAASKRRAQEPEYLQLREVHFWPDDYLGWGGGY